MPRQGPHCCTIEQETTSRHVSYIHGSADECSLGVLKKMIETGNFVESEDSHCRVRRNIEVP